MTQPDPNQQPAAQQPPVGEPKMLTQEQVNAILAEEKRKTLAKFEGYDDLKAKAQKFDEIEAQNATELEKAVKKAADEARADMSVNTNKKLVRAEVKAAAAELGFHNPAVAATQLSDKFAGVKVSEDGDVDLDAVKALVKKLAEDEPYLVKTDTGRPQPLLGQGHHQPPVNAGKERALAEAKKRFPEKYADKA